MIENGTAQRDWPGKPPLHVIERRMAASALVNVDDSWPKTENEQIYPYERRIMTVAVDNEYIVYRILLQGLLLQDNSETAESWLSCRSSEFERELSELERQVEVFLNYQEDWDEEGAARIPSDAVSSALRFLDVLRRQRPGRAPSGAAPSPDGEIVIYWHSPSNYVEVNFDGTEKLVLGWRSDSTEVNLVEDEEGDTSDQGKGRVWAELTSLLEKHFQ